MSRQLFQFETGEGCGQFPEAGREKTRRSSACEQWAGQTCYQTWPDQLCLQISDSTRYSHFKDPRTSSYRLCIRPRLIGQKNKTHVIIDEFCFLYCEKLSQPLLCCWTKESRTATHVKAFFCVFSQDCEQIKVWADMDGLIFCTFSSYVQLNTFQTFLKSLTGTSNGLNLKK